MAIEQLRQHNLSASGTVAPDVATPLAVSRLQVRRLVALCADSLNEAVRATEELSGRMETLRGELESLKGDGRRP